MGLITRCPKCESRFLIEPEELSEHEGLVRCGECSHIFDGLDALENKIPTLTRKLSGSTASASVGSTNPFVGMPDLNLNSEPEFKSEPKLDWGDEPASMPKVSFGSPAVTIEKIPEVEPSVMRHRQVTPSYEAGLGGLHQSEPTLRGESRSMRQSPPMHEPDFSDAHEGTGMLGTLLWGLGSLLAIILLCGQLVYIYRNDIATNVPSMRSTLESICSKLGCEVSLSRHLDRISIEGAALEQSGATQAEGQPTEQLLRFTLRNRYEKNQPWPHLMIELSDPSSTVVVRKMVAPYQYLPSSLVDQSFAPQQEVRLALPITVMGLQINGFNIQKFFP